MSGFEAEMAQHDEEWREARERGYSGADMPDGVRQARVTVSRVQRTDWGWQWSLRFEALDGSGSVWANRNLEHEVGRSIAAQESAAMGYDGPLSGLEQACAEGTFDDLVCTVKVESVEGEKKTFRNVYVRQVVGRREAPPPEAGAPARTDDDIPF